MLDITFVREHSDIVRASEKRRGHDLKIVDDALKTDEQWRKALKEVETLKHKRNVVSEEINKAKKEKNNPLAEKKIKEMRSVADEIKTQEDLVNALLLKRNETLKRVG